MDRKALLVGRLAHLELDVFDITDGDYCAQSPKFEVFRFVVCSIASGESCILSNVLIDLAGAPEK